MVNPLDDNRITTLKAILNSDGKTIKNVQADSNSRRVNVSDGTSGSDNGGSHALRNDDRATVLMAVSYIDGITPVAIYCDSNGSLLVKST